MKHAKITKVLIHVHYGYIMTRGNEMKVNENCLIKIARSNSLKEYRKYSCLSLFCTSLKGIYFFFNSY